MQTYEWVAVDTVGRRVEGRTWSVDETELDRELERSGLTLTTAKASAGGRERRERKLRSQELLTFTTQLATVTSAGVPLVEGLRGIGRRAPSPELRALMEEMITDLEAGEPLSVAMARHPRAFPRVYRASVEAGEASGALDHVLERLGRYLEWARSMRATAVQASIYPAILFAALFGLVLILLYFVLPRILSLFPGDAIDLPVQTRIVLGASAFLRGNAPALGSGLAALVFGFVALRRRAAGRRFLSGALLWLPKMGPLLAKIATSRFASTAATLQSAGCDVFTMLRIAGETCGNEAMAGSFERATECVRRGMPIADGLETEPRIDPLLVQMVAVGEKSGSLDRCMNRLVEYYDDEVPRAVKRFVTFLEPVMLVIAGGVVAFILLAALLPIFKLYESL